jgi:predicted metal-dependent hydrolase
MPVGSPLTVRRPTLGIGPDAPACWTPRRPEFACAANSVSLLMPYMEPYFVRSVAAALPHLDPERAGRTRGFRAQETEHHRPHRVFNRVLTARYPGLTRVERAADRYYRWIGHRGGDELNVAVAAASETIAYSAARWAAGRRTALFDGADPVVAELFWWHLAEEVEHKAVAYDVHRAYRGRRRYHLAAMALSVLTVIIFVTAGTTVMLAAERRLHRPDAWVRLAGWALSFAFELLPNLVLSLLPRFHPDQFVDPLWYDLWRQEFGLNRLSSKDPPSTITTFDAHEPEPDR